MSIRFEKIYVLDSFGSFGGGYWLQLPAGSGTTREETHMTSGCKICLAMLTCIGLGAFGDEALHSEARPPAYLIGQIDVSDADGYAREYLPKAREIIKSHGGKLVAAAGAAATGSHVIAVDGTPPERVVIYMYPNLDALRAWRNDPDYVKVRAVGEKYAKYHTFAIEGSLANQP
jgi:uncharacterized protein (DUF1330 family)